MEKKYIKNSSLRCNYTDDGKLILTVSDENPLTIVNGADEVLELLKVIVKPSTYGEAFETINRMIYISENNFREMFEILVSKNCIKEVDEECLNTLTEFHREKYSRQIESLHTLKNVEMVDAVQMQNSIIASKVCIIGMGGTGSYLSIALASMGVEKLIIVDFDGVELSNTSRQILYTEDDIGKLKIDVAERELKKHNSHLEIEKYNIKIEEEKDLDFLENHRDLDLLILCADTPRGEIQYLVDSAMQKYEIPWFLYGPFHHSQIMVGPYMIPGKTKSYAEIFPKKKFLKDYRTEEINNSFIASISDPYNGFASQFAAIETLKILTGYKESNILNARYYIDTDKWTMENIKYD